MVEKTLAFERDHVAAAWRNRLTVLLGNPGGATPLEKRVAEVFGPSQILDRLARLDPIWTARFVVHAPDSPFCVADDDLHDVSLDLLREGQFWTIYLGHSGAGIVVVRRTVCRSRRLGRTEDPAVPAYSLPAVALPAR